AVAGGRRRPDEGGVRGGEAAGRRAVDAVAGDADVVGRRRPGQARGRPRDGRRQARRRRRRRRVGDGGGGLVGRGAGVAGGVAGGDQVVVRPGRQPRVAVAGGRRRPDEGGVRGGEAAGRRAVDAVAGDADVVGRRRPGQARGRPRDGRRQARRRRRRRRVGDGGGGLVGRGAGVAGGV